MMPFRGVEHFPHESEERNASEAKARSHWEIQAVKDLRDKEELRHVEKLEKVEKSPGEEKLGDGGQTETKQAQVQPGQHCEGKISNFYR